MASSSSTSAQAGNNQRGKKEMEKQQNVYGVAVNRRHNNKALSPLWSAQEDAMLLEYVSSHGPWEWKLISKQITGRTANGCRNRWWEQLFLDTNTNRLIKLKAILKMKEAGVRYGKKFGRLPKELPKEIAANLNRSKNGQLHNRRTSSTFGSTSLNPVSLTTTRNVILQPATEPSPPFRHPRPSPIPPPPSSSPSPLSQPLSQPTFFDFLGVGSV